MCLKGFKLSPVLTSALRSTSHWIRADPELSDMFVNKSTNQFYNKYDVIRLPKLAETLRKISESNNSDIFYNSKLTELIVEEMNENGARVTLEDFKNYNVIVHVNRFMINFDVNYSIYVPPPPSSGILVAYIMKLMKGFNVSSKVFSSNQTLSLYYHRLIESIKHAYAKRIDIGDEKFLDIKEVSGKMS